ncbi:MAG: hypothetical protein IJQ56_08780 [Synergistaceae bacterium]|nr:hypothetical protein [Synergistaceae bacterium]
MKKYFALCLLLLLCFAVNVSASSLETASRNANEKLQANGFLLSEEIEEIWQSEKTPDVLEKISESQQRKILDEYRTASEAAAKSSLEFGSSITDDLERTLYQSGVENNKVLKATRAIAKKYGIKAGDIFTIEFHSAYSE